MNSGDLTVPVHLPCEKCGEHPATENWDATPGPFLAHKGAFNLERWCACCVLRAQVENARQLAAALPVLEGRLQERCPSLARS